MPKTVKKYELLGLISFQQYTDNLMSDTTQIDVTDDIPYDLSVIIWKDKNLCAKCRKNPIHISLSNNFKHIFCLTCLTSMAKERMNEYIDTLDQIEDDPAPPTW